MDLRKSIAPRRWLLAAFASLFLMLLSFPAFAGRLQVRDPGGLFNATDKAALQESATEYPFDVRVVATSEHDQKADFDRYVRAQVNEPNIVVIGVDRAHRFTSVHFGTGLGVAPSQFKAIEQAGSPHFREGNWKAGVLAILTETRQASHLAGGATHTGAASAPRTAGSTVFFVLVVVLVIGGLIALVGSVLSRRARAAQLGPPGYPPGGPPGAYPPGGPYPPGYGPGGYGPGYGGGSGIGAGIAGAGLGGLVGYQLGKMAGDRHDVHERDENAAGVAGGGDHDRDNFDAGGSTGEWDDGGGGDWGGGDSGGGGDWGGGGDSGGGGSDW